ncbi:pentapeptide repeat-containing protein [Stenomitos frigidus]|uniref:Pentapeptide repeat-containing protein n=1 Tax=Stenomitos frigidus ULC18 TaxID=2107698 RepID=A0A2T1E805_9CYAN|nr:pentapeptide repeat-containing protein [Stenomitos frigidus]PSB28815.1 hypothetical protein C7B82_12565 [Stenomitos frigidus ULC18]
MLKRQFETIASAFKRVNLRTWLLLVLSTTILVVLIGWLGSWGLRVVQDWAQLQQTPTDATQKQFNASLEIVKAIVGGIGTLATIVGGIVLYLNFRVANRNAELTESRLITERFSKAVEQLGSDKIEVRLGGIYALERIAQDSVRDHWTIMEVLTAFVRERSPVEPIQKPQVKESFAEHYLQPQSETEAKLMPVTKDVQAALTVIGRREVKNDPDQKSLDLSDTNLNSADLYRAQLEGAKFEGANLKSANLEGGSLKSAFLGNADLSGALLHNADLPGAKLSSALLNSAELEGAHLAYADLRGANLIGANLSNANLRRTILDSSLLIGANLTDVRGLMGRQLEFAKLCHTTMADGTISDRDCAEMGLPPSTNSASEAEPDNP